MKRLTSILLTFALVAACAASPAQQPGERVVFSASDSARPLDLSWTLNDDIQPESWLRVLGDSMHCLWQYSVTSLTAGDGKQVPISHRFTREDQNKRWGFYARNPVIAGGQTSSAIAAGSEIEARGEFAPSKIAGVGFSFRVESAPSWDGPWKAVTEWTTVGISAAEAASMEAYLRSDGSLHVLYVDAYGNPANPGARKLSIRETGGQEVATASANGCAVRMPKSDSPGDSDRVTVRDDKGFEAASTARPPPSIGGCNTYFGEFHHHTEYSGDGQRPIRDSLDSARDELGLDFASPADHVAFSRGYKVDDYFDILDEYDQPGRYVTLLGYELGSRSGHFNPYYRDRAAAAKFDAAIKDFRTDPRNSKPSTFTLEPFLKHFAPEEIVVIPHHTNTTSGAVLGADGLPMWRSFDWRGADDRYNTVVEIVQSRGSFECEDRDKDWRIYAGGYGSSIRTALAKGLRFGFVGCTDNHTGWPTRAYARAGYVGLTGIQCPELTREAIFDALRSRRTYATSGARIVLDFVLNGKYPMGSAAKLPAAAKREFTVVVRGTAPLDRVEIVSQGALLAKLATDGKLDLETVWTDPRPDAPVDDCYYYLRVRQTDGHCAWSSPIWVDYSEGRARGGEWRIGGLFRSELRVRKHRKDHQTVKPEPVYGPTGCIPPV